VFRVDPDHGLQSGNGSANSKGGQSIMQDRTRRTLAAAVEHLPALRAGPVVQSGGAATRPRRSLLFPVRR
jgi:hypothetical protein